MTPGAAGRADDPVDLRLAAPAVAAWLVAWQARAVPPGWVAVGSVLALALGVLLAVRGRGRARVVGVCLLCAAAAGVATSLRVEARTTGQLAELGAARAAVVVEAVVLDDPRRAAPRPGRDPTVVVRLRAERVTSAGRTTTLREPLLLLSTDLRWLPVLPSQRVRLQGRLQPAQRGDEVAAVLSGRGALQVLTGPSPVQRVAGSLRAGLRAAVAPLPAAERGLLPGLVVGDTGALGDDVRTDFQTVGLTHLTAVSGSNVAIVLAVVLAAAGRVGLPLRLRPVLAGLALVGFVVLARPSPSVLRAAGMGAVGLLALVGGGRRAALPALGATVLALVLLEPGLAASPGFALSVLATAGLVLLAPPWRRALARRLPPRLADALAVPAAAQVACGPVVVTLAGSLGVLTVPANLLAEPAVAPATVLGVAAALVAPVCLPLAQGIAWLGYLPTAWLVGVARVGADLPLAAVPWPDGGRGALLLLVLTAAGLVVLRHPVPRRVVGVLALAVGTAVGTLALAAPGWPPRDWFLVMCDVGQGDALVLRAAQHEAVVVDAGPDPAAVDRCLRSLGVRRVPLVLLTHLHADHVDGLPGVLRGRAVGLLEVGPADDPPQQAREVEGWVRAAGVPVQRAGLGETRQVGPLRWTVLAPLRSYHGSSSDPNNDSVVVRLVVGGSTVLLSGDAEPEAQADLLASGADLRADVLKVPHHGSAHQDPAFLDAVHPRVALTSVGAGNTYGHPAAATLARLRGGGARSYRTDVDGDVALVHRGGALAVVSRHGSGPG